MVRSSQARRDSFAATTGQERNPENAKRLGQSGHSEIGNGFLGAFTTSDGEHHAREAGLFGRLRYSYCSAIRMFSRAARRAGSQAARSTMARAMTNEPPISAGESANSMPWPSTGFEQRLVM
jgi:hypothetical protein